MSRLLDGVGSNHHHCDALENVQRNSTEMLVAEIDSIPFEPNVSTARVLKAGPSISGWQAVNKGLSKDQRQQLSSLGRHGELLDTLARVCFLGSQMGKGRNWTAEKSRMAAERFESLDYLCQVLEALGDFTWGWIKSNKKGHRLVVDGPFGVLVFQSRILCDGPEYQGEVPEWPSNAKTVAAWLDSYLSHINKEASALQ
jgi:hypothetical protein